MENPQFILNLLWGLKLMSFIKGGVLTVEQNEEFLDA